MNTDAFNKSAYALLSEGVELLRAHAGEGDLIDRYCDAVDEVRAQYRAAKGAQAPAPGVIPSGYRLATGWRLAPPKTFLCGPCPAPRAWAVFVSDDFVCCVACSLSVRALEPTPAPAPEPSAPPAGHHVILEVDATTPILPERCYMPTENPDGSMTTKFPAGQAFTPPAGVPRCPYRFHWCGVAPCDNERCAELHDHRCSGCQFGRPVNPPPASVPVTVTVATRERPSHCQCPFHECTGKLENPDNEVCERCYRARGDECATVATGGVPASEDGAHLRSNCDGCARGLPLVSGNHHGSTPWDIQQCTADRYPVDTARSVPPGPVVPDVLRSLSPDELAKFKPITDEQIDAALAAGARDRYMAEHPTMPVPPGPVPGRANVCAECKRDNQSLSAMGLCDACRPNRAPGPVPVEAENSFRPTWGERFRAQDPAPASEPAPTCSAPCAFRTCPRTCELAPGHSPDRDHSHASRPNEAGHTWPASEPTVRPLSVRLARYLGRHLAGTQVGADLIACVNEVAALEAELAEAIDTAKVRGGRIFTLTEEVSAARAEVDRVHRRAQEERAEAVAALVAKDAELADMKRDRDRGAKDYCALMDMRDALFVEHETLKREATARVRSMREAAADKARRYLIELGHPGLADSVAIVILALPLDAGTATVTGCAHLNCAHSQAGNQDCDTGAQADAIKAAVADERERCLAWLQGYWTDARVSADRVKAGIRSGDDFGAWLRSGAPGAVK